MSSFIKIISLYNPNNFVAILYATSPANLVVEMGTRHSHQILLSWVISHISLGMGLLPDTQDHGLPMPRECRERFPATDFKGNR